MARASDPGGSPWEIIVNFALLEMAKIPGVTSKSGISCLGGLGPSRLVQIVFQFHIPHILAIKLFWNFDYLSSSQKFPNRNFWPSPPKGHPPIPGGGWGAFPRWLLESWLDMMANEKVVKNVNLNQNHCDIFPLAAIFGTPYIPYPRYRGYQIWPPGEKCHNDFDSD